jgi:hypothetical protein
MPASELETISLGLASSMRVASEPEAKAAEHHRMDGANAGAGEDREGRLGDHRHVDQDAIARLPTPSDWS